MKKMLVIITAAVVFTACKKSTTDVPLTPTPDVAKVKTWTGDANTSTYFYNAQGKLDKYTNTDGSKVEYEYLPGVINRKIYGAGGVFLYSYKYELNAAGFATRETVSNNATYEEVKQFNADNTIAKSTSKINGVTNTADFFYSNGNCDSIRHKGNNGNWSSTVVWTFYTDKPNVLTDENTGDNIYGKGNKNMLKTEMYRFNDGSTNTVVNYTYEYDAQGRVIKETSTQGNKIGISLLTYY